MIVVEKLSYQTILDSISFSIPSRKTLAVIGHNGAGKTTLFHVLLGLKFITSGKYCLDEKVVGYVPERPYLEMEEKLEGFLRLHLNLTNFPTTLQKEEILRVANLVGLQHQLKSKFKTFSKGMLQKALLAQAMLASPKLIFLDEPMSGLDPDSRKELLNHLIQLKQSGINLVFSSHVMEDVVSLSDFVLVLDQGKQKFFGPTVEWSAQ
jgi:ABC-2 type transport system ATP-binding protein